jgi:cyclopropane fatty-acyl-phospholipid synthase-like methyltransferase
MQQSEEWVDTWFDSPYYHLLYRDRNEPEAHAFIDNLLTYLHPKPEANVPDLACGRGRHATYLHQKEFDVTGVDLCPGNLRVAKQHETERLRFAVHDMRSVYSGKSWVVFFNLFTSFGYFKTDTENVVALSATAEALKHGEKMGIGFMNTNRTIEHLMASETKEKPRGFPSHPAPAGGWLYR